MTVDGEHSGIIGCVYSEHYELIHIIHMIEFKDHEAHGEFLAGNHPHLFMCFMVNK